MPSVRVVATIVALVLVTHARSTAQSPGLHVRPMAPELTDLPSAGAARSHSFRALINRLDASDVIVYVQCESDALLLTRGLNARLMFMSAGGGYRYVVARLRCDLPELDRLALLAHELRHAVEVADAPQVVDDQSMLRHYLHVGIEVQPTGVRARTFETMDARLAERSVRREVATADAAAMAAGAGALRWE